MSNLIIYPEHTAKRKAPVNLAEEDIAIFRHEFSRQITETRLVTLKDADVLQQVIFQLNNPRLYLTYTYNVYDTKPTTFQIYLKYLLFLLPAQKVEHAVWITDDWSHGYFHWMTDALPRLIVAEPYISNHVVLLPETYRDYKFIEQSLSFFSIKPYYTSFRRVHCKELVLPSHTALSGNYNKDILHKLRAKFQSGKTLPQPSRKIYVSRQNAAKRMITNDQEVVKLLITCGFEIHFFEKYSFNEQVKLMQETKVLVGMHGAGLTNMLFMPENGAILELRNNTDKNNNCYFSMASDLNHDYYYLLNQGNTSDTHKVNIFVDIQALKNIVEHMCG